MVAAADLGAKTEHKVSRLLKDDIVSLQETEFASFNEPRAGISKNVQEAWSFDGHNVDEVLSP